MFPHKSSNPVTRREAMRKMGNGFGMMAFASLVNESIARAGGVVSSDGQMGAAKLDHPAKVKRVIFLFMNGGCSAVDSFDPKPMLTKYDGQPMPGGGIKTERRTGELMRSPFAFKKYGQCGMDSASSGQTWAAWRTTSAGSARCTPKSQITSRLAS
jgi:hypothetical protein